MNAITKLRQKPLEALVKAARMAERTGAWDTALEYYEAALTRVADSGTARNAAEILRWIGAVHTERGDLELAEETYEASLVIARLNDMPDQVAAVLNSQAAIAQFSGNPDRAQQLYLEAKSLAESAREPRMVAVVDQNLGMLANIRGDISGALARYRSALEHSREAQDERAIIAALNNMGMAFVDLEELDRAERCFEEAFEIAQREHDRHSLGYVQVNRAELHIRRQQFEHARQCCDDGFAIFTKLESKPGLSEAHKFYGMIYRETGKAHLAEIHLGLASNLATSAGNQLLVAEIQHELARVHQDEHRGRDAIRCLNMAHGLFCELQARREILDIERQITDLEHTYLTVVEGWSADAIETKDPYTQGHSRRVANYTRQLGAAIGVEGHDLTWLEIGALLHDVGKTVVPPAVLSKPGALTEGEWEIMQGHTVIGGEIVDDLKLPHTINPMVRNHHERWDGRGYPDGLAGENIPLNARILSVVDVYDALTSARSYRGAFSPEKAMFMVRREAGRGLDPTLVELFETEVWEPTAV